LTDANQMAILASKAGDEIVQFIFHASNAVCFDLRQATRKAAVLAVSENL